ncbi:NADP-dependent oxidoreductase domain-containing protein [Leptodontidium sp. 2 PMI_412]|nr:NADP-dependent oxidoreductase domain-containing protein [Leptodontidium sp. 2 PMI_412]
MTSKIPTRRLGKEGPLIPALGYGTMGLSSHYGKIPDDETRFAILDRAYELGIRFWDTSDMYGDSEELIGKWFARTGKRDEIFLSSKFGYKARDRSLKRLGVEHIDLYYIHVPDGKTPIEDTIETMVELKKAGKIKYLELCGPNKKGLRRAEAVHHIDSVQVEYSLFALDIEDPEEGCLETCRELGIAVTGRYKTRDDFEANDVRRLFPRFSAEDFPKNLKFVEYIQSAAEKKGCTAAQLCLAILMAQGDDIIPIPGTKNIERLEENAGSLNVVLTEAELKDIRHEISSIPLSGSHRAGAYATIHGIETPERK